MNIKKARAAISKEKMKSDKCCIVVHKEVQSGRLIRPKQCSLCFVPCKPVAHHPDYSKPLEVVWVCRKCHSILHSIIKRGKNYHATKSLLNKKDAKYISECNCSTLCFYKTQYPDVIVMVNKLAEQEGRNAHNTAKFILLSVIPLLLDNKIELGQFAEMLKKAGRIMIEAGAAAMSKKDGGK